MENTFLLTRGEAAHDVAAQAGTRCFARQFAELETPRGRRAGA